MKANPIRRAFLIAGAASLLATNALAQNKPITIIVPYAPGGSADLVTRTIAQFAAPGIGAPVVVWWAGVLRRARLRMGTPY